MTPKEQTIQDLYMFVKELSAQNPLIYFESTNIAALQLVERFEKDVLIVDYPDYLPPRKI